MLQRDSQFGPIEIKSKSPQARNWGRSCGCCRKSDSKSCNFEPIWIVLSLLYPFFLTLSKSPCYGPKKDLLISLRKCRVKQVAGNHIKGKTLVQAGKIKNERVLLVKTLTGTVRRLWVERWINERGLLVKTPLGHRKPNKVVDFAKESDYRNPRHKVWILK